MGNNFDEHVFDSLVGEIVKTKMPLCLKSLKELEKKVLLARVAQWWERTTTIWQNWMKD